MSYRLYTDKANKFQCTIQVEGTSLSNSQARIILETNNEMSYLFKGKLYENGVCDFDLPKLKHILSEGDKGLLRLEIIADDVHFEPWNSEFNVVADKKVSVVVQEQATNERPKIVVNEITLSKVEEKKNIVEKTPEPVKEKIQEMVEEPKIVKEEQPKSEGRKIKLTKNQIEMLLKNKKI